MQIKRYQTAQTVLEYVLMITAVTAIMIAMSTMVKRSAQGMVKAVADQIGFQQNAEQNAADGYLVNMAVQARSEHRRGVREYLGNVTYTYDDRDFQQREVLTNMGAR